MSAAKPQAPSWTTRTDNPSDSSSELDLQHTVAKASVGLPDPFDPDVGMAAAELGRLRQGRVSQLGVRQREETVVE